MDVAGQFEKMIAYCDRIVLAPYLRDRLRQQFNYFRLQALCDHDRRDNKRVIAMHWEMIKRTRHGRYIIERFAGNPTNWRPVAAFVCDTERYPVRQAAAANTVAQVPAAASSAELLPHDFFVNLLRDYERASEKSKSPRRTLVRLGLHYLAAEAKLKKLDRSPTTIRGVWKLLWPELEKAGLLNRFRNDVVLKSRVRNFIANGFCIEGNDQKTKIETAGKPIRRGDPDCDYTGKRGINPRDLTNTAGPRLVVYEDTQKGYCPPTARGFGRPRI